MKKNKLILLTIFLLTIFALNIPLFAQTIPSNIQTSLNKINPKDFGYLNSVMKTSSPQNIDINQVKKNLSPSTKKQLDNLSNTEKEVLKNYADDNLDSSALKETEEEEESSSVNSKKRRTRGQSLKRFGYSIFNQNSQLTTSFTPVNDNYILGPGDILSINIWGKIEQELQLDISSSGTVILPKVGELSLAGIRYGNLRQVLIQKLSKEFVNFDLSVTMKKLRTIRIFILGNVNSPGAYLVNGMTSIFQALFVSNGVNLSGSLRNIKLIRNGKVVSKTDLYHYLLYGNNSHDPILKDNDTIFVETVGPLVQISGNVKRPAIYELHPNKQGNTSLKKIIHYAGNTNAKAYLNRIQIERIEKGQFSKVYDSIFSSFENYNKSIQKEKVFDGDKITILPILDFLTNFVEIQGNVFRQGKYEFKKHNTLEKLIDSAQGLQPNTFQDRIEIYRLETNSTEPTIFTYKLTDDLSKINLQEFDRIRIFSLDEVTQRQTIKITGAVQKAGIYNLFHDMTLTDILFKAVLNENANKKEIELMRKNEMGKYYLTSFNLIKNKNKANTFKLNKDDHIFIKTAFDLDNTKTVSLSGEISFPGKYPFEEGESLYSVLNRANFFSDHAFLKGLHFSRSSESNSNISKIISNEEKKAVFDQELISSLTNKEQSLAIELTQARFKALDYIKQTLRKNSNRVILKFSDKESFLKLAKTIQLKPDDRISIPQTPTTIEIVGGIQNTNKVLFEPNKNLDYYASLLGGFTKYANKSEILVFKINGSVSKNTKNIERGDIIYIPEKIHIPFNWITFTNKLFSILDTIGKGFISIEILKSIK